MYRLGLRSYLPYTLLSRARSGAAAARLWRVAATDQGPQANGQEEQQAAAAHSAGWHERMLRCGTASPAQN